MARVLGMREGEHGGGGVGKKIQVKAAQTIAFSANICVIASYDGETANGGKY